MVMLFTLICALFFLVTLPGESAMSDQFHPPGGSGSHLCRDRADYFLPRQFRVSTCSMCLIYLYPTMSEFKIHVLNGVTLLLQMTAQKSREPSSVQSQRRPDGTVETTPDNHTRSDMEAQMTTHSLPSNLWSVKLVIPDVEDEASLLPVSEILPKSKSRRWLQCCQAAQKCCQRQLDQGNSSDKPVEGVEQKPQVGHCPMTWDGYSCVEATSAGKIAQVTCPPFICTKQVNPQARAAKHCMSNGTWWVSEESQMEWTDYSTCLDMDTSSLHTEMTIAIVCNAISIVLLIPALLVFLLLRSLRIQQRIRLHTCMFATLLVSSITAMLWERLVIMDMLLTPLQESFVHAKPNACKFLNLTSRLAKTSSFFWMFCEGFHLHWLMVRAFKPINTMGLYMAIGWGIPSCLVVIYLCLRIVLYDTDSCWLKTLGALEWIIDAPTVACIALNVIFLILILRKLVFQLKKQPDDVGSLRRTMKALLLLVPLLGVQQFCILYRPHVDQPGYFVYAVVSALIVNLQGAAVAIIFCFLNSEVQTSILEGIKKLRRKLQPARCDVSRTVTALSLVSITPRISLMPLRPQNVARDGSFQQQPGLDRQQPRENDTADDNPTSLGDEDSPVQQLLGVVSQQPRENDSNMADDNPTSLGDEDSPVQQLSKIVCQQPRENDAADENPTSLGQEDKPDRQPLEAVYHQLRENYTTEKETRLLGYQSSYEKAGKMNLHEIRKINDNLSLQRTYVGKKPDNSKVTQTQNDNELVLNADVLLQESTENSDL